MKHKIKHEEDHCFALFAGDLDCPSGGWSDYKDRYRTSHEAAKTGANFAWWHVVDLRTAKMVDFGRGDQ